MFGKATTLVVPVELRALVVNESFADAEVRRWRMNFFQLLRHASPEPPPFFGEIEDGFCRKEHNRGVYLHWLVPVALRRGRIGKDAGAPVFDPLPNRWLVVRTIGREGPSRSWLVESDALDPADDPRRPTLGGSTFAYVDEHGAAQPTRLGRSVPLAAPLDPGPEPSAFARRRAKFPTSLNALGMGHATFLAYQPLVNDVFSLHDPLDDLEPAQKARGLDYVVAGWHSDPAEDPLARGTQGAIARLEELQWHVRDATAEQRGQLRRCTYHGALFGVSWAAARPPSSEQARSPRVAVGHDPVDAWVALVEKADAEAPGGRSLGEDALAVLAALQHGELSSLVEPDGDVRLEQVARAARFGARPDGWRWVLDGPEDDGGVLAADVATGLQALDERQARHDALRRETQGLQRELYDTWWRLEVHRSDDAPGSPRRAAIEARIADLASGELAVAIRTRTKELEAIQRDLDATRRAVEAALAGTRWTLERRIRDVFWEPRDPTLLMTGIRPKELPRTDRRPDPFAGDGPLECLLASGLRAAAVPPALAGRVADEVVAAQVAEFAADLGAGELAPHHRRWTQPWDPMFVEWEVEWFPLPHADSNGRLWKFTGSEDRLDRTTDELEAAGLSRARGHVVRGRNFLVAQNNQMLADRVRQLVDSTPPARRAEWKPLQDLVDDVTRHGFLSQPLVDFNRMLQSRCTQVGLLPAEAALRELVGDEHASQPCSPDPRMQDELGLRQGQLKLNKLLVYDGFGQCVRLVGGLDERRELFQDPAKARDLRPARDRTVMRLAPRRFVELKPRILDPTRLRFDLVKPAGSERDARGRFDPVLGWVVYNRLDKGLLYFDGSGEWIGESRIAQGRLEDDLDRIRHPDLKAFAGIATDRAELESLLELIDRSLWLVEGGAALEQRQLAAWMGRPLAMVRAQLQLECVRPRRAEAADTPAESLLPEHERPGRVRRNLERYRDLRFGVSLGLGEHRHDGLIGYVRGGELFAVHPPRAAVRRMRHAADDTMEIGFGEPVELTLLVDPRAGVHARTGVLPDVTVHVPADRAAAALARMEVRFRFLSLLTTVEKAAVADGPDAFALPLPALRAGTWQWEETKAGASRRFAVRDVPSWHEGHRSPALLRDGRLVLRDVGRTTK